MSALLRPVDYSCECERVNSPPGSDVHVRPDCPAAVHADGILATSIVHGGAYKSFRGSAAEAKRLADEAVAELTGRRYEDFRLDRTHEPWTPWFFDVAWDDTLVLTDYRNAEMTVLCITDTD